MVAVVEGDALARATVSADFAVESASRRRHLKHLGWLITAGLVIAYVAVLLTYQRSLSEDFVTPRPEAKEVAVSLVPTNVYAAERKVNMSVLLFPGRDYLDPDGRLTQPVSVLITPSVTATEITFAAGRVPSPHEVMLPVSGLVQNYPFDRYSFTYTVSASTVSNGETIGVPLTVSTFFRVPGWSLSAQDSQTFLGHQEVITGSIARDFSTIGIALLFLTLMIIIASLVIRVVRSVAANRMELTIAIAAWFTALLFALVPLRNAFPGQPPLGSWMDILVFFWVVAIVMVSLALVASMLLHRARITARKYAEPSD